jgi:hypothetical protein
VSLGDNVAVRRLPPSADICWGVSTLGFLDADPASPDVSGRRAAVIGRQGPSLGFLAFAAVAAFQVALILVHSPWRDETQAVMIARLPLDRLFGALHYEGHPALWYLLLAAVWNMGGGLFTLQIVQAAVAVGFQAVFWRCAPFSWRMKLLISLGYFMLFEYGVVARNYGLGVLLFFAFVALRRTRWSWVLLALMCNTAVHLAVLAGVGALLLIFVERRWSWIGAALLAVSGAIALVTMFPAPDTFPRPVVGFALTAHLSNAVQTMAADIAPVPVGLYPAIWLWSPPAPIAAALGAVTMMLGLMVFRRDWRLAAAYLIFCIGLVVIGVAIYPIHLRHVGLIVILLVGLLWIDKDRSGADPGMLARVWFSALAAGGLWMAACSFFQPFSYARPLADWIEARGLAKAPWAALPGVLGTDVSGEFNRPTFNVQKDCWNTYQKWNYDFDWSPTGEPLGRRLETIAEALGPTYLLTDSPLDAGRDLRARRLATFSGAIFSQVDPRPRLFVYRIDPARSVPRRLPACDPAG